MYMLVYVQSTSQEICKTLVMVAALGEASYSQQWEGDFLTPACLSFYLKFYLTCEDMVLSQNKN